MKIILVGTGYVGLVAGIGFAEVGHDVVCVDIDPLKVKQLQSGISTVYETGLQDLLKKNIETKRISFTSNSRAAYESADAIFIGVGTPEKPDGSANLEYISTVTKEIAESLNHDCLFVIKSTVPVGTNDMVEQFLKDNLRNRNIHVEVASNPEFLAQGSAVHDTLYPARIIVGVESQWAEAILREIYKPFNAPLVVMSRRSAEMTKYAANDFLALKLSYMNDIANLCELVGADIQEVSKGMSYDERIGAKFLGAGIGYGGSCFPKDTKALAYLANQYGYPLKTVQAAVEINKEQKVILFKKASKRLMSFSKLKVAVLGLTFKPGTDDLREAPSVDNISLLLAQGADIVAYDPVGIDNCKKIFPEGRLQKGSIRYTESIEDALNQASICFIFTEWKQIKEILPQQFATLMRIPLVYDGRNIYQPTEMRSAHVEYYGIGRGHR